MILLIAPSFTAAAEEPESAVGPVMRLLKSGRLPEERLPAVVELVCERGNEHDLAYVFEQAHGPDGFPGELRLEALRGLANAARSRNARPAGDLSRLKQLVRRDQDTAVRLAAVRLAGLWKVESLADRLRDLASDKKSPPALRTAAIEALSAIGGETARETLEALTAAGHPQRVRYLAVAALADIDADRAARRAAAVLKDGGTGDDPGPMIGAFLNLRGGSQKLADALKGAEIPTDVAKLALRSMYSVGRNDAELSDVLSKAAGVATGRESYSEEEIQQLVAEIKTEGDPERGEAVFRREELSCRKCHSINKAGGDVGPDLGSIGSSSPPDYILRSILLPGESIKEEFKTSVILTSQGKVYTGIVADRNENRLILKTAEAERVVVPKADVEFEREGDSLMPQGLTKFLTHDELVDLVAFLSALGQPGQYAIPPASVVHRWRVMNHVPRELAADVPDEFLFRQKVLNAGNDNWVPAYSKVSGELPLSELVETTGQHCLYLAAEVEVTRPGPAEIRLDSAEGVFVWVDDRPLGASRSLTTELQDGGHRITVRVDTRRSPQTLRLEVAPAAGSSAAVRVVEGT